MKHYVALAAPCLLAILGGQDTHDRDFWQSLDEGERVVLIQGVYRGLTESLEIMGEEAIRQRNRDPYWTPPFVHEYSAKRLKEYYSENVGYDYALIAGLVDAFYSNPDNAHIDIMYALHVIMLHQEGETTRANELLLLKQKEVLKGN